MSIEKDGQGPQEAEAPETSLTTRIYWGILVVLQVVMAVELLLLLIEQQWLNASLVVGIMVLTMSPAVLAPRLNVRIPAEFQLLAIAFVFATLFLGEVLRYYDRFAWWDTALHAFSGLLMGVFGFLLVYLLNENRRVDLQLRPRFVAFFAFLFAVAVGTFWEIFEFVVDQLFGTGMQSGGLYDTMLDLMFDAVGAAAISFFAWWYLRRGERSFVARWVHKFISRNPRLFR